MWAALAALALLVLAAGAIVGMVTSDSGDDQSATSDTGVTQPAAGATTASIVPPVTEPVPPITSVPTDSVITVPSITGTTTTATGTTSTVTTTPAAGVGTWPSGQSGWTVILASVAESQGRSEADAIAQRATTAGLPQVGVLLSTDYPSLRPGFWVTYTGVYESESEARSALPAAQAAGFASAYPRQVTP